MTPSDRDQPAPGNDIEQRRRLAQSWHDNAAGWTAAVREQRIESRRRVTDAAILDAVFALRPRRLLDLGCGEGWLCRAVAAQGIAAVGIDASAPLIEAARASGGDYRQLAYDEIAGAAATLGRYDLLVCNFSLMEAQLQPLLRSLLSLAATPATLLIQTLHPGEPLQPDGWRSESFSGFGDGFPATMPWYYRSLESWLGLLHDSGWQLIARMEPPHPATGCPASLLLSARPAATSGQP